MEVLQARILEWVAMPYSREGDARLQLVFGPSGPRTVVKPRRGPAQVLRLPKDFPQPVQIWPPSGEEGTHALGSDKGGISCEDT